MVLFTLVGQQPHQSILIVLIYLRAFWEHSWFTTTHTHIFKTLTLVNHEPSWYFLYFVVRSHIPPPPQAWCLVDLARITKHHIQLSIHHIIASLISLGTLTWLAALRLRAIWVFNTDMLVLWYNPHQIQRVSIQLLIIASKSGSILLLCLEHMVLPESASQPQVAHIPEKVVLCRALSHAYTLLSMSVQSDNLVRIRCCTELPDPV